MQGDRHVQKPISRRAISLSVSRLERSAVLVHSSNALAISQKASATSCFALRGGTVTPLLVRRLSTSCIRQQKLVVMETTVDFMLSAGIREGVRPCMMVLGFAGQPGRCGMGMYFSVCSSLMWSSRSLEGY